MKKIIVVINIIISMIVFISCSNTQGNIKQAEVSSSTEVADKLKEADLIKDMTLLVQHNIDMNKDGKEEKIEMYTSAPKNSDGNIMWDDMNKWLLQVTKDENVYKLYEGDIQLGKMDFWIYIDANDKFHIVNIITTGTNIAMIAHKHDDANNTFTSEEIYNLKDINVKFYYK